MASYVIPTNLRKPRLPPYIDEPKLDLQMKVASHLSLLSRCQGT